jgi:hypothetical protein
MGVLDDYDADSEERYQLRDSPKKQVPDRGSFGFNESQPLTDEEFMQNLNLNEEEFSEY